MIENAEKQLWCEVVNQAIEDYTMDLTRYNATLTKKVAAYWKNKAEFWLFKSKKTNVGSLNWICFNYGLSLNGIRSSLRERINGEVAEQKTIQGRRSR